MSPNKPTYGKVDREYGMRMFTTPPEQDGPVWMVNFMKYKEEATYADGSRGISGQEADDKYAPTEILTELEETELKETELETADWAMAANPESSIVSLLA